MYVTAYPYVLSATPCYPGFSVVQRVCHPIPLSPAKRPCFDGRKCNIRYVIADLAGSDRDDEWEGGRYRMRLPRLLFMSLSSLGCGRVALAGFFSSRFSNTLTVKTLPSPARSQNFKMLDKYNSGTIFPFPCSPHRRTRADSLGRNIRSNLANYCPNQVTPTLPRPRIPRMLELPQLRNLYTHPLLFPLKLKFGYQRLIFICLKGVFWMILLIGRRDRCGARLLVLSVGFEF